MVSSLNVKHAAVVALVILTGCNTAVQELDFEKARAAGAKFSTRAGPPCVSSNFAASGNESFGLGSSASGVALSVDCNLGFLLTDTSGVKAEMGIFQDFQLQNGWKVDRVELLFDTRKDLQHNPVARQPSDMFTTLEASEEDSQSVGRHSFRWIHAPEVGSTRPMALAALSADAVNYMRVYPRIMIRGLAGTDPYVRITPADPDIQVLSYARARAAGANFTQNPLSAGTCPFLGQKDGASVGWAEAVHEGVTFMADCVPQQVLPVIPPPTGGRVDATAYEDFRLKNGWRIKEVHVTFPSEPHVDFMDDSNKVFRWLRQPQVGSDDPSMSVHLAVNPALALTVNVEVLIEGPAGRDPYQ